MASNVKPRDLGGGLRFGQLSANSGYLMMVSAPAHGDADLDAIAAACPWSMRVSSIQQLIETPADIRLRLVHSGDMPYFERIDIVAHASAGLMAIGDELLTLTSPLLSSLGTWATIVRGSTAGKPDGTVRFLGCNLVNAPAIGKRDLATDGKLLHVALARFCGQSTAGSTRALWPEDFAGGEFNHLDALEWRDKEGDRPPVPYMVSVSWARPNGGGDEIQTYTGPFLPTTDGDWVTKPRITPAFAGRVASEALPKFIAAFTEADDWADRLAKPQRRRGAPLSIPVATWDIVSTSGQRKVALSLTLEGSCLRVEVIGGDVWSFWTQDLE